MDLRANLYEETSFQKENHKIDEIIVFDNLDKKIVGIGEIGLDYHYTKDNKDKQIEVFEHQLNIAEKLNLPVVIHSREAAGDTLEILKKHIMTQIKNFFDEIKGFEDEDYLNKNDIYLDEDNSFYFTHEFLILPFSSCEIDEEILNLIEFKIPFNKIYLYLNEYAIKNIVKKIIL